jgi:carbon storage regulator
LVYIGFPLLKEAAMLVLSRRVGEQIVIAGSIRLTIVAVKGDAVRLGIMAPPEVAVDRQEVHERRAEFTKGALSESAGPKSSDVIDRDEDRVRRHSPAGLVAPCVPGVPSDDGVNRCGTRKGPRRSRT